MQRGFVDGPPIERNVGRTNLDEMGIGPIGAPFVGHEVDRQRRSDRHRIGKRAGERVDPARAAVVCVAGLDLHRARLRIGVDSSVPTADRQEHDDERRSQPHRAQSTLAI